MSRIVKPTDHGMSGIDLKSVATTVSTLIFPALNHFQFEASLAMSVASGPGTTGLAAWIIEVFEDEAGSNLIHTVTAVTAIDTKTDGTYSVFTWGGSGAEVFNGTLATGAGALRVNPFVRLSLDVTEANDAGGAATGDVHLLAEGFNR